MPRSSAAALPCRQADADAARVDGEVLHPACRASHDVGICPHRVEQGSLKIAAMDAPIRRAVALLGCLAKRDAGETASGRGLDRDGRWRDGDGPERLRRVPVRSGCAWHSGKAGCRRRSPPGCAACSSSVTRKPARASINAAVSPPIPAPAMRMLREDATASGRSDCLGQRALRRPRREWRRALDRADRASSNRGR